MNDREPIYIHPPVIPDIKDAGSGELALDLGDDKFGDQPYGRFAQASEVAAATEGIHKAIMNARSRHPASHTISRPRQYESRHGDSARDVEQSPLQTAAEAVAPIPPEDLETARQEIAKLRAQRRAMDNQAPIDPEIE